MSHVTPERFKQIKTQFAAVDDAIVQFYLDTASRMVDGSWGEDQEFGEIAFACHLMTLDGLGTDANSKQSAKGFSDFQTIKSADVTLVRFQREASSTPYQEWLTSTPCGKQFAFMVKMIRGGPRVAMAATGHITSGYAKDAPLGWPGVFYA